MRPGRQSPGIERRTEGGRHDPRGFNEAGATKPRNSCYSGGPSTTTHRGFNEAGATKPRNSRSGAVAHALTQPASMRPGRQSPGIASPRLITRPAPCASMRPGRQSPGIGGPLPTLFTARTRFNEAGATKPRNFWRDCATCRRARASMRPGRQSPGIRP